MENRQINLRLSLVTAMILLAAFSRVIPHMPNFSPLGVIGLFGAAHLNKKWQAFVIPITATWLSDLFIDNVIYAQYYPTFTWFYDGFYWQYGSYSLIALSGLIIFKKVNAQRVLGGALASTTIFFLISNFGSWIGSNFYPQTFEGLITCYEAGIPFLKGTVLGDLFYSIILFSSFGIAQKKLPSLDRSQ